MATWQIGESGTAVVLDDQARGEVTFTVTNTGSRQDRAMLTITPLDGAAEAWFTVDEPQRVVPAGGSVIYRVQVSIPPGTATGVYGFQAVAYSADHDPGETSVTSKRVTVEVRKYTPPPPRPFPWWIVAVVAAVLILVIIVVVVVTRDGGGDAPDTVSGISAGGGGGSGEVLLEWDAAPGATGYRVLRSDAPDGDFEEVADLDTTTGSVTVAPEVTLVRSEQHLYFPRRDLFTEPDTSSSFEYIDAAAGERCFRVVAYNDSGEASRSTAACASPP